MGYRHNINGLLKHLLLLCLSGLLAIECVAERPSVKRGRDGRALSAMMPYPSWMV